MNTSFATGMPPERHNQSLIKYVGILSYDGTAYHGWQTQKKFTSIEETIKKKFKNTFGTPLHSLIAASRTDAGVHAHGQIVLFKHVLALDPEKLTKVINDHLPSDIHFLKIIYAPIGFHPWYNVTMKEYHYLFTFQRPMPDYSRFVSYIRAQFEPELLNEALQLYVGTHNFKAFSANVSAETDEAYTKTINAIKLEYVAPKNAWRIIFKGASFLRRMIRRMVGAGMYVAQKKLDPHIYIQQSLHNKKRILEFPTAESCGLVLQSIFYHEGL